MCRSFFYSQNSRKELMRLQEEVENRTVNLVVSTTKLTTKLSEVVENSDA